MFYCGLFPELTADARAVLVSGLSHIEAGLQLADIEASLAALGRQGGLLDHYAVGAKHGDVDGTVTHTGTVPL